ncbi:lysophospholipid acyltransferase family protein [soil metagenome]
MKRFFRAVLSIYAFLVFFIFMFLLLPLFCYSFFRGRISGGNFLYKVCRFWASAFYFFTGIKHFNIYEHTPAPGHAYIFISNHISYLDIPEIMKATEGFNVRILGKAEMGKLPIFGFIYRQGAVLVDRRDSKARMRSVKELKKFLTHQISIFICPEGTFNKTHQPLKDFYDGAFRIAIEMQKPLQPILFPDTYSRLSYKSIFSFSPGKCRAIFLTPTDTTGLTQADLRELKEKIYQQMADGLRRYNASWISASKPATYNQ